MNAVEQWLTGRGETIACPMGARLTPEQCRVQQDRAVHDPVARITCYGCHHSDLPEHAPVSLPGVAPIGKCRVCGVEVRETRSYCDQHRPRKFAQFRPVTTPSTEAAEELVTDDKPKENETMSTQPSTIETPIEKRNGTPPPRRHFTTEDYRRMLTSYDNLPAKGGHRKAWLASNQLSSGTLARWRHLVEEPASDFSCPDHDQASDPDGDIALVITPPTTVPIAEVERLQAELLEAKAELRREQDARRHAEVEARNHGLLYRRVSSLYTDLDQLLDDVVNRTRPAVEVIDRSEVEDRLGTAQDALYDAMIHLVAWEAQTVAESVDQAEGVEG